MNFGSIQGVDISHWNDIKDIDKLSLCDFVYFKCSQGVGWTDSLMKSHYPLLKGKTYRGVYHFLDFTLNHYAKGSELAWGAAQAKYAYSIIQNDLPELPLWLDIENNEGDSSWEKITVGIFGNIGRVLKIAMGFKLEWEKLSGKKMGVYTRYEFANYMDNFTDGDLAIAKYPYALMDSDGLISDFEGLSPATSIGKWNNWKFWQYSSSASGRAMGIGGDVDLDVFNGTEEDWSIYVGGALPVTVPDVPEDMPSNTPDDSIPPAQATTLQSLNIRTGVGTSSPILTVAPVNTVLDVLETAYDSGRNQWIRCGYKEWACVKFGETQLLKF